MILHIHAVQWLSRGNVMTRLLQCMPTLLKLFRDEEPHWYEIMCSFKFHFYLSILVDVLQRLNKIEYQFSL